MTAGNELSRVHVVHPLPELGQPFDITATADERMALARRFDLLALDELRGAGVLRPGELAGSVRVEGRLRATATQRCVITDEPVPAAIDAGFRRLFAAPPPTEAAEIEIDPLADDVEPLAGDRLDVGEILAEELALALDPYPRAPGAELPAGGEDDPEPRPFAALARLHRR